MLPKRNIPYIIHPFPAVAKFFWVVGNVRYPRFWRYRAEAWKLTGARFARLLRARRHIEASFMWRQSRRTAFGRPRQIGKPPPAAWEIFGKSQGGLKPGRKDSFQTFSVGPSCPAKRVSVSGGGDATHRQGAAMGGCGLARLFARGPPGAGEASRRHPLP